MIKISEHEDKQLVISGPYVAIITFERDYCPANPLKEWDEMGELLFWEDRRDDRGRIGAEIEENPENVILVDYADYGSSGSRLRVQTKAPATIEAAEEAGAIWIPDKGLLGYVKNYGGWTRRRALEKYARQACTPMLAWMNGDVWGFTVKLYEPILDEFGDIIEDAEEYGRRDNEVAEDSCWGFYGRDEIKYMIEGHIIPFLKYESKIEVPQQYRYYRENFENWIKEFGGIQIWHARNVMHFTPRGAEVPDWWDAVQGGVITEMETFEWKEAA